jgi:hypothetical protein
VAVGYNRNLLFCIWLSCPLHVSGFVAFVDVWSIRLNRKSVILRVSCALPLWCSLTLDLFSIHRSTSRVT